MEGAQALIFLGSQRRGLAIIKSASRAEYLLLLPAPHLPWESGLPGAFPSIQQVLTRKRKQN